MRVLYMGHQQDLTRGKGGKWHSAMLLLAPGLELVVENLFKMKSLQPPNMRLHRRLWSKNQLYFNCSCCSQSFFNKSCLPSLPTESFNVLKFLALCGARDQSQKVPDHSCTQGKTCQWEGMIILSSCKVLDCHVVACTCALSNLQLLRETWRETLTEK